MCGINGFYLTNNVINKKINLKKANLKLKHRGPDNQGIYYSPDKFVGLGHTRLSIQDLSVSANQPMLSNCKRYVITFNGEIYNFNIIKKFLDNKSKKYIYKSKSDTEVLLNLFSYCIEERKRFSYFLSKLQGIFSFAIWDNKEKELFLARDSFGVKPLYYSQREKGIFFSSEIKAIAELGVEIRDIDPVSINNYLTYIWCPGDGTPVNNIKKIYPGEYLIVKNGFINKKKLWYKNSYLKQKKLNYSKSECISNTKKFLKKAVHKQLLSDAPLGCFLSGGLDSSSIVAFAREKIPDLKCFTIKNKDSLKEEGFIEDFSYAEKVANHLDVKLEAIEVDKNTLINNIEDMVYTMDEPISDPASINVQLISRLAKQSGIKVLLSGTGGDDLFTGYRRHYALYNEKYWAFLPKLIKNALYWGSLSLQTRNPLERRIKRVLSAANLSPDERIVNYFRWNQPQDLINFYNPEFLELLRSSNLSDPLIKHLELVPKEFSRMERMLSLEQRFFLIDHNLLYTDKMSMSEGVEVRVPFLDNDLVKFASRIPMKYKTRRGNLKWILKKAMEPYLPSEVIYRPKTGFGVPLRSWIKGDLREWVNDILSYESIKKRGLFNPKAVTKMIEDNYKNKIDASYSILSIVCIEIWCRKFLNLS